MSKRKPNNTRVRLERTMRSLLRSNHVAVVDVDIPEVTELQVMVNWRNCRQIVSRHIVDAICDIPHQWTIYISAMHVGQDGTQYLKSVEATPQGIYLAARLKEVVEAEYRNLLKDCNTQHVIGCAWIAIPDQVELDEAHASRIFDAVNAWPAREVA
ncbi:MAG: hypothetical protein ACKVIS_11070 [Pseudomonadales bacterium]